MSTLRSCRSLAALACIACASLAGCGSPPAAVVVDEEPDDSPGVTSSRSLRRQLGRGMADQLLEFLRSEESDWVHPKVVGGSSTCPAFFALQVKPVAKQVEEGGEITYTGTADECLNLVAKDILEEMLSTRQGRMRVKRKGGDACVIGAGPEVHWLRNLWQDDNPVRVRRSWYLSSRTRPVSSARDS